MIVLVAVVALGHLQFWSVFINVVEVLIDIDAMFGCQGRALYIWFLVTGRSQRCGLDWSGHHMLRTREMGLDGRRYISNVAVIGPSRMFVTLIHRSAACESCVKITIEL
jgi:hypothetical protein